MPGLAAGALVRARCSVPAGSLAWSSSTPNRRPPSAQRGACHRRSVPAGKTAAGAQKLHPAGSSRQFKRWAGHSPGRRQLLAAPWKAPAGVYAQRAPPFASAMGRPRTAQMKRPSTPWNVPATAAKRAQTDRGSWAVNEPPLPANVSGFRSPKPRPRRVEPYQLRSRSVR
jgi:hypothetical protein